MFPTKKQFSNWSLPTKWGFIGSLAGLVVFFFWLIGHTLGFTERLLATSPIPRDSLEVNKEDFRERFEVEGKRLEKISEDNDALMEKVKSSTNDSIRNLRQFDYLNGKEPYDNYEIFLQKYYGVNGHAAMGDILVEDLLGREVEWAVKVDNIKYLSEATMLIFTANKSVCKPKNCPDNFTPISWAEFTDRDGVFPLPTQIKIGDFMHIRGKLVLFPQEKSSDKPGLRLTAHIHPEKIRFNEEK